MPEEARRSDLYEGTVGWGEDGGNFADLGDGTEPALVNVTLYSGRDRSQPLRSDVAQGTRIRCRIAGPLYYVPPNGTRVMVAIPESQFHIPGAGVVMFTTGPAPASQFAKDRIIIDFGPKTHVVIRGMSVVLQDAPAAGGARCFLGVGTPYSGGARGIYALTEQGSGFSATASKAGVFAAVAGVAKSFAQCTDTEASMTCNVGGVAGCKIAGGDVTAFGANFYSYVAGTYLGATAVAANTALWGVNGAGAVPSTSVFIGL